MRLLNSSFRTDFNSIRLNTHNTLEHEISKLIEAYRLIKDDKKKVITEAIFHNGTRADIFIPEDFRVIEILHSEKEAEALEKTGTYPEQLDITLKTSEEVLKNAGNLFYQ